MADNDRVHQSALNNLKNKYYIMLVYLLQGLEAGTQENLNHPFYGGPE